MANRTDGRSSTLALVVEGRISTSDMAKGLAPPMETKIARHIQRAAEDVLQVERRSLHPTLHRLERKGWVSSKWKQLAGAIPRVMAEGGLRCDGGN